MISTYLFQIQQEEICGDPGGQDERRWTLQTNEKIKEKEKINVVHVASSFWYFIAVYRLMATDTGCFMTYFL